MEKKFSFSIEAAAHLSSRKFKLSLKFFLEKIILMKRKCNVVKGVYDQIILNPRA